MGCWPGAGIDGVQAESRLTLLLFPILRRLLVFAAFLAIPLIGAELLARKLIGDAVTHAVAARIGASPKVGFGSTPLLVQIVHGKLATVSVSATDARIGGLPPLALSAQLRDVHLRSLISLEGAIGSLSVEARLLRTGVRDLLSTPACIDSLPAGVRTELTPTPRVDLLAGRIDLLPPRGRAAEVRLRPQAYAGTLRFLISGLTVAGSSFSSAQLATVRTQTSCSRTLKNLPFGIALVSASAEPGALELDFAGAGASFSALG